MNDKPTMLTRRALRVQQSSNCLLYVFTLTAAQILSIAGISRVSRDDTGNLIGYQRSQVRRHIQDITEYVNGDNVIFPNPIIIALPSTVRFTNGRGIGVEGDGSDQGRIHIPILPVGSPPVGWIVDGQQRAIALSQAQCPELIVPVNAFVTDSLSTQRDQFLRINNTRPLPRGLVTELLPSIDTALSPRLALRKTPSALCDLLNTDEQSPFHGLIKRASTDPKTHPGAVVTDTSIVNMLSDSLTHPSGCLYPYRNMATGETEFSGIWQLLLTYWTAVKETFPDAWGKPPTASRLMHGAGLRAVGRLMDRIMATVDLGEKTATEQVMKDLALVAPHCRWTSGVWEELDLRWNDVQNVGRHTNLLSSHLVRIYIREKTSAR